MNAADPFADLADSGTSRLKEVTRLGTLPPIEPGSLRDLAVKLIFGHVWNRPALSTRDRRLVTLGVLAALDATVEMTYHVNGGLASGELSEEELREVAIQVAPYAGYPRASTLNSIIDEATRAASEAQ